MSDDRINDLESRVGRIEDALIELRINVANLVGEMKSLRYVFIALGAAWLGIDVSGAIA